LARPVSAIDIDPDMLDRAKTLVAEAKMSNCQFIMAGDERRSCRPRTGQLRGVLRQIS
jgi:hypothetical protein